MITVNKDYHYCAFALRCRDYSRHLATLSEYLGRESEWDGVESISMRVPGGVTSNESTYNASPTYSIPHTNYHTIYVFLINSVPVARPRDIAVSETVFYRRMKIKHNNVRERGRNRQTERGATLSQNGDFVQRLMQIYSTRKKNKQNIQFVLLAVAVIFKIIITIINM